MEGSGSIHEFLNRIESEGRLPQLAAELDGYRVRVVLTAHPTQFYPDEVLAIVADLTSALESDDTNAAYELLLQMGKTRFRNSAKPTPLDEARSLIWYLEDVFYRAIPEIQSLIDDHLDQDGTSGSVRTEPIVELGFWPGGDRDGNPFVTADLTERIAGILRATVLRLYQSDLRDLSRRLTFPGVSERLEHIRDRIATTSEVAGGDAEPYPDSEEFVRDLQEVLASVVADHMGLFADPLRQLIFRASTFGFHLASMDLRQDSRVHARVVGDIIHAAGLIAESDVETWSERPPEERISLMTSALDRLPSPHALATTLPKGIAHDTLESIRVLERIQKRNGARGMHRYIISNTQSEADVLAVWFLVQAAGVSLDSIELDIVPLFETIADLHASTGIMERLYDDLSYGSHLERRGQHQTIMLGFSDGTKDGGYVTANWEIYKAKRRLSSQATRREIGVTFFDGRGGPPARGGGNTHRFYRSLGKSVLSRELHVTIQGQTISSKYGTVDAARYNLERLVTAGLESRVGASSTRTMTDSQSSLIDELSAIAEGAYRDLKSDPRFLEYLEEITPIHFYGKTNNASRPTQRGGGSALQLDTLRAIPFVGAWSQVKQNVPGYYGLGTAVEHLEAAGRGDEVCRLYSESSYFRSLADNAMQSILKTSFALTSYLKDSDRFGAFWERLRDESDRTIRALRRLSGTPELLSGEPVTRESILLRESVVTPILVIQQYALHATRDASLRVASESDKTLERMIVKSLAASVNASRNAV